MPKYFCPKCYKKGEVVELKVHYPAGLSFPVYICPKCKSTFDEKTLKEVPEVHEWGREWKRLEIEKKETIKQRFGKPTFSQKIKKGIKKSKGHGKRFYDWFISKRSEASHIYFNALPAIIGVVASFIIFSMIFPNGYLLVAGVLFSLGMLFPREDVFGFVKALFIFLGVIIAFLGILFIHKFLALVLLFFGYASLSFRPLSEEAYYFEGALAVFRMIIGALIALSPWLVFSLPAYDTVAIGLFLIGVGFFVFSVPEHEVPATVSGKGITIINEIGEKHASIFSFVSFLFVLGGVISVISALNADIGLSSFRTILFIILGITSAFVAYSTPGHYRGEVGFPLYLLLLFAVTTAYPDMLGEAVFGPWWAQISAGMESISKPLSTSFSQLHQGMSDMWLMFTCPTCYYEEQMKKRIKSQPQGSVLSLELVKFKPYTDYLYLDQKLVAYVLMQNRGEDKIKGLKVEIENPQIKIKKGKKYEWNEIEVGKRIESCSGTPEGSSCSWKGEIYPNEYVDFTFELGNEGNKPWHVILNGDGGDYLDQCRCVREEGEDFDCYPNDIEGCRIGNCYKVTPEEFSEEQENALSCEKTIGEDLEEVYICQMKSDECKPEDYLVFKYGNYPIKIKFNYSFIYEADVSLQYIAMKKDLYTKLMREGKLVQKEVVSKYSGGPVQLGIWAPMEPAVIGSGKEKTITLSFRISNQGTGKVLKERDGKETTLTFRIPEGEKAEIVDSAEQVSKEKVKDCEVSSKSITCYLSYDLEQGETAGFTFLVKLGNFNEEIKTFTFTGSVEYIYGDEREIQITLAPAP